MPKVWSRSSPSHYLKHQKQVVFTGLVEETGFLCKEYKSEGHGGKQNSSRTNTAQPYLFMDLFVFLVLLHSFFLLLPHPFFLIFSSPKDSVSIHQRQRGDSHRLQWFLKPFRPSDLSPLERGDTNHLFGVSKHGESSKWVNKTKARRQMLSRPFSLIHFRLFFPRAIKVRTVLYQGGFGEVSGDHRRDVSEG